MEKKCIALLLVCLVVIAGVGVEAEEEYTAQQKDCFSYCWHGCFFPTAFCNTWCASVCEHPIILDEMSDEVKYPVPTKEDYLRDTAKGTGLPETSKNV